MRRRTPEQRRLHLENDYSQRRQKRRDARTQREDGAAEEAREAYWRDKPVFRTKEEVKELCKTEKLNDDGRKDILGKVRERLGRKTPACVCTTCGEMCLYREGTFKKLTDGWFKRFEVTQEAYDA